MTTIISLLFVLVVAGLVFRELGKKNKKSESVAPLAADEAPPTQTGKFRVKQMMEKTEASRARQPQVAEVTQGSEQEESAPGEKLPDPFSKK